MMATHYNSVPVWRWGTNDGQFTFIGDVAVARHFQGKGLAAPWRRTWYG